MRMILLSAVLGLGVGIAGTTGTFGAPGAPGVGDAAAANTLVQKSYVVVRRSRRCYSRRVCYINRWGHRHCYYKTYCRR